MAKESGVLPSSYERRARLTPGLLLLLPLALTLAALGLDKTPVVSSVLGLIVAAGGPFVLATLVASAGRRLEPALHERWGGTPSNQLLRIHSQQETAGQRSIWRTSLEKVTGVELLSADDEIDDLSAADSVIKSAFGQVRYIGQSSEYPVVAAENAQYGFERNLFAVRVWARALAVICVIASIISLVVGAISVEAFTLAAIANFALLIGWIFVPSESRTKDAGFRYAAQLLNQVAKIANEKS